MVLERAKPARLHFTPKKRETIFLRGESNHLSGCVLRVVVQGDRTLKYPREKRPMVWKVLHDDKND
jgi:hypothetical protein